MPLSQRKLPIVKLAVCLYGLDFELKIHWGIDVLRQCVNLHRRGLGKLCNTDTGHRSTLQLDAYKNDCN